MMFTRIDHVGIAVSSIDDELPAWQERFGMEPSHRETVEEQGVEAVLFDVGENHVELIAPLGPETGVARFIESRGPGLHHVAYQVEDIDAVLAQLKESGVTLIDEETDEKTSYQIVGEFEADVKKGKISVSSPIARAIIGKKLGDSVEVNTPGGGKSYEIAKVAWR